MTLALLSLLVLSQPRPSPTSPPSKDAGVTSTRSTADAGVPEPMRVPAPATTVELDKVKKEVAELRTRVTELEVRLSKADSLARDVDQLKSQLDTLKTRLDKADERREAEEREVALREEKRAETSSLINGSLQQLGTTGNTSNVDSWLRTAESHSRGNAQKFIQLARTALANQDLVATRQFLTLALMEP